MAQEYKIFVKDDGLINNEAGDWCFDKYRLLKLYLDIFSEGMKKKFNNRVYIDLFAGSGRAKIENQDKICLSSPLLALSVKVSFDKYIFCEKDPEKLSALRKRVMRDFPENNVSFILGDVNDASIVKEIEDEIPKYSKTNKVLSFCFVDPYSLKLNFNTIKRLSKYMMDFLILLATGMDANRNLSIYIQESHNLLDNFLGNKDWPIRWEQVLKQKGTTDSFKIFLADEYAKSMRDIDYLPVGADKMKLIRSSNKNLPLYHLAYFSKHKRGYAFWEEVLNYSDDQLTLDL